MPRARGRCGDVGDRLSPLVEHAADRAGRRPSSCSTDSSSVSASSSSESSRLLEVVERRRSPSSRPALRPPPFGRVGSARRVDRLDHRLGRPARLARARRGRARSFPAASPTAAPRRRSPGRCSACGASSTMASISPRQTPTAPHDVLRPLACRHGLAAVVARRRSRPVTTITSTMPDADDDPDDRGRASATVLRRRHLVDEGDEQLPEALHGRDADTLVGRMRELDLRPEREHVEAAAPCCR